MKHHPMQPLELDEHDVIRFKRNKIIDWLFETGKLDLNEIAKMNFSKDDQMQLAQLLGYSVRGYGDLSYVRKDNLIEVDYQAELLRQRSMKK